MSIKRSARLSRRLAMGTAVSAALLAVWGSVASAAPASCTDCQMTRRATCGGFLEGPVIDQQGRVWLVDVIGGAIKRSDRDGHCETVAEAPGGPNGLALGPDGLVYIANQNQGLMVFDPAVGTTRVVAGEYEGEPIKGANDLAFDPKGGLYMTVPQGDLFNPQGRLFYLPPGANELVLVADGLSYPNGVAVSADGKRVLIAEMMMKRILAVPAVGAESPFNVSHVWAHTAGGVGPDGIHLEKDGRLFVANLERREILVFAPDAVLEQAIRLPEEAGPVTTNVTSNGQQLYVTESAKGELWQMPLPPRP